MHIVIFGLAMSSSWGNGHATTYRSLVKGLNACGHRVTFFERDVPWYAENRDATHFDYCRLVLYRSLDELRLGYAAELMDADAVIVGSYVPEAPRLVDWLDGAVSAALCFYDIDTPVTLESLQAGSCEYLRPDQISRFDVYFSFAGGAALERLRALGARCPRPLYCSVDTDLYRPLPAEAPSAGGAAGQRWQLGYMGTFAADRQPAVDALLIEVAARCPAERFVIAGPGYPDTESWPDNVDWLAHVGPDRHRWFYAAQAFTLNVTRAAMVALGSSPSVRLFEAAACECCIVSDPWPGLDEVLEPGREVLVAGSGAEVLELMAATSPAQRAAMGRAARQRVLAEHSHLRRAEYLVERLREDAEVSHAAT